MKILAIMPSLPYPLDDGIRVRAFHFLKGLAEKHQVRLVAFADPSSRRDELLELVEEIVEIPAPSAGQVYRGISGKMLRMGSVWPVSFEMHGCVSKLCAGWQPDRVWITHLRMAEYIPAGHEPATLIDIIDDQVLLRQENWKTEAEDPGRLRRWKWLREVGLLERRAGKRSGVALFASDRDADAFGHWAVSCRRITIANGVDLERFHPVADQADPAYAVFVGNYQHPPNIQAVRNIVEEIWPRLQEKGVTLRCRVVGPHLPDDLARKAQAVGVNPLGWVDDVRPHVQNAALVLSPLNSGGGIKNKVLEAWAMGKALVALPAGVAGLGEQARQVCRVAGDFDEFADCVAELAWDPQKRESLGSKARKLVEQEYRWEEKVKEFVDCISGLVGTAR